MDSKQERQQHQQAASSHASKASSFTQRDDQSVLAASLPFTTEPPIKPQKQPLTRRVKEAFRSKTNRKVAACCLQASVAGWHDASAGSLLPYMESYYSINYTEVSTIFVGAFAGFVLAGLFNNYLYDRLGMGKAIVLGATLQTLGYAVLIAPPPFAVYPVVYALFIGGGIAIQLAQCVTWLSSLPRATLLMNYAQAAYGFGALCSPLAATAFVTEGLRFSYFFSVSLALGCMNVLSLFLNFYLDPEHAAPRHRGKAGPSTSTGNTEAAGHENEVAPATVELGADGAEAVGADVPLEERMTVSERNAAILRNRIVWLVALFLFFYVGAEVSIGGWAVSFLLEDRQGGKSVGYVATGFWAGITIGRLTLPRVQQRFGDRLCMYIFIALSILLEISIWTWRQLIGNAVAICLVGFLMATFFSIGITALTKLLPRHLHTGSIGLVTAMGQGGSACFPFITGVLAQKFSPIALQPVIIALMVGMAVVFFFIPPVDRRQE